MPYRRTEPKQWPARNEVRDLARQHTLEAMERLIELMKTSRSNFVQMNAARTVLLTGRPEPRQNPRFRRVGPRGLKEVNVTITKFGETQDASKQRDRGLPVVRGRRKGPRDAGDAGGAGVPALRGQRTGVRVQPPVQDRAATDVPGTGPQARDRSGRAAAGTEAPGETRKGRETRAK
jgi:hypothetical protein